MICDCMAQQTPIQHLGTPATQLRPVYMRENTSPSRPVAAKRGKSQPSQLLYENFLPLSPVSSARERRRRDGVKSPFREIGTN